MDATDEADAKVLMCLKELGIEPTIGAKAELAMLAMDRMMGLGEDLDTALLEAFVIFRRLHVVGPKQ